MITFDQAAGLWYVSIQWKPGGPYAFIQGTRDAGPDFHWPRCLLLFDNVRSRCLLAKSFDG